MTFSQMEYDANQLAQLTQNKDQIMQQVRAELAMANAQELLNVKTRRRI